MITIEYGKFLINQSKRLCHSPGTLRITVVRFQVAVLPFHLTPRHCLFAMAVCKAQFWFQEEIYIPPL